MSEHKDQDQNFVLGCLYIKEGDPEEALKSFSKSFKQYSTKDKDEIPLDLISFYGLALAMAGKDREEGLKLCRRAVASESSKAEFYLNLGKVYILCKQKEKAVNAFRKGIKIKPGHQALLNELNRLGQRRRALLSFLPRNNFINHSLGKILNRHFKVFFRKTR